jgi:hypothetical protein
VDHERGNNNRDVASRLAGAYGIVPASAMD